VLPSVYQGNYNAVSRNGEDALFPLLKKNKISFYAYSPAAGGFFALKGPNSAESGGRFDTSFTLGKIYTDRYGKPSLYKVMVLLFIGNERYRLLRN
jgi:aflatoxin B1 aldehyde reductase